MILYGPVGVGKPIANPSAPGSGPSPLTSRPCHLAGGRATSLAALRTARPRLILDDFAMRELAPDPGRRPLRAHHRAGPAGSLVLTSNRAPQDWYPLFPNPVVAESLLDRLINNSHQLFMNGPSYRPNKRPGQRGTTTTKEASQ